MLFCRLHLQIAESAIINVFAASTVGTIGRTRCAAITRPGARERSNIVPTRNANLGTSSGVSTAAEFRAKKNTRSVCTQASKPPHFSFFHFTAIRPRVQASAGYRYLLHIISGKVSCALGVLRGLVITMAIITQLVKHRFHGRCVHYVSWEVNRRTVRHTGPCSWSCMQLHLVPGWEH